MRVLIACEESQVVCKAFRARGHEAYSADIQDCSGGHPEWHIKGDVLNILNDGWDMMIAHPPCTYLSYAGIRWFNIAEFGYKALDRFDKMVDALRFFYELYSAPIGKICIENPRGFIATYLKPTQLINPYYFGDEASKPTYLWLKNLNNLYHNDKPNLFDKNITHVDKGEFVEHITKDGKIKRDAKWYYEAVSLPPDKRSAVRSKTFPGIAKAMAEQWG